MSETQTDDKEKVKVFVTCNVNGEMTTDTYEIDSASFDWGPDADGALVIMESDRSLVAIYHRSYWIRCWTSESGEVKEGEAT